ncbi:helix-turn-helix domain-containing protein [Erythrobacter crassostreae]|uniref:AraC family transcriptional regulator n=1 Tax=Erythrobacter crassostreae TaxID=2828328 RepID=A0A9X1F422_9SPHN|nr:helix-turn-helix domain-containing protein [Erythrobacter crassostrea]MBV7258425.1 AraC family transcriptional regulator [Erythrobacter crassostrea]
MNSELDAAAKLRSRTGATDKGDPLSINRAPDKRIAPWVSRSMVAYAYQKGAETLEGALCNDAPYIRSAVGVDWTATTRDGDLAIRDETFLCGQHSTIMPLKYSGGIKVAGLMLRPGALRALFGVNDGNMLDRIVSIERGGVDDDEVTSLFDESLAPTAWLLRIENWLADFVKRTGVAEPDPIAQALELQAFVDPNGSLSKFAERQNVSLRTIERTAKRDFGLPPNQIMRRARILDLAAKLCGVADQEDEEITLRFFDQAHQIREFQIFFGMTPLEFQRNRSAILTLSLEIRQARRLELLDWIEPGAIRPWMRKPLLAARAQLNQTVN